jgi:hypothetical protein
LMRDIDTGIPFRWIVSKIGSIAIPSCMREES